MKDLDAEITRRERYRRVFERLRARAHTRSSLLQAAPVSPELSLRWVLSNEAWITQRLRRAALDRDFKFSPQVKIELKTDKLREFYVASWPERILIMVLAEILSEQVTPRLSPAVYSFQKGRGPFQALNALSEFVRARPSGSLYALKRDISSYGDSINQEILFAKLGAELPLFNQSPRYSELLWQAIRIEYFSKAAPETSATLIRGIPSGSPLVPTLENFYLGSLDRELTTAPGCFYARYGDDFVFATADAGEAARASLRIDEIAAGLDLLIKPEKKKDLRLCRNPGATRAAFGDPATGFPWLGTRINFDGSLGCKPERHAETRDFLRVEIDRLVKRVGGLDFPLDTQVQILGNGVRALIDPRRETLMRSAIYPQQNAAVARSLDRNLVHYLRQSLEQHWGLKRKAAWKIVRRVRAKSIFFRYRTSRARKPAKAAA